MARRKRSRGLGSWRDGSPRVRAIRARQLCRDVQEIRQSDPLALRTACRRLRELLSPFGYEDPAARIRARACGCPVR